MGTADSKTAHKDTKNKMVKCSVDCFVPCGIHFILLVFLLVLDVVIKPVAAAGKGAM